MEARTRVLLVAGIVAVAAVVVWRQASTRDPWVAPPEVESPPDEPPIQPAVVPPQRTLVDDIETDERASDVASPATGRATEDASSQVEPGPIVHVVDAQTGSELSGIRVEWGVPWQFAQQRMPRGGRSETFALSPFLLPRDRPRLAGTTRTYWFRAEGYGWQRESVSDEATEEMTVRLERAGDLEVWILGPKLPPNTALRLSKSPSNLPLAELDAELDRAQLFVGLEPGRYSARVQQGAWFDRPLELGSADVEVRAGERTVVEIAVRDTVPPPARVRVGGTLRISRRWRNTERVYLSLQPERDLARLDDTWHTVYFRDLERTDDPEVYRWSVANAIYPGRYLLTIQGTEHRELLVVPPEGADELQIVVPDPAEVTVRLRDSSTGDAVELERISWHTEVPAEVRGYGLEVVERDEDEAAFHFQAPVGRIQVVVRDERFALQKPWLDLLPGENEFELELVPPSPR
ncbi:MAG: hypothetical protein KDB80_12970 [Planctomycetes bacterium]|nr:hypothetical protein [Planctomycetota bacterium]